MNKNQRETHDNQQQADASKLIAETMSKIKHRIVVFSGKGGVGKTTVSVNLAYALADKGLRVGILDADITGPNVPQMVGIKEQVEAEEGKILPHDVNGVKVVSLASMLPVGVPVIWRGPMRSKAIEQLLGEAKWNELDFLIIDLPPGTGDEVMTIVQRTSPDMALIVTTPQEVSIIDARRAANMAKKMNLERIGIVENMSGLICPHCQETINLFGREGGGKIATELDTEFLGSIPIDPDARIGADTGKPIILEKPDTTVSEKFVDIAERVQNILTELPAAKEGS